MNKHLEVSVEFFNDLCFGFVEMELLTKLRSRRSAQEEFNSENGVCKILQVYKIR